MERIGDGWNWKEEIRRCNPVSLSPAGHWGLGKWTGSESD